MKKRIFWGLNHKTLMDAELKMLVDMGYEVYSPKIVKNDASFRSSGVDYEYDKTLSIPQNDIDKLNSFDFYYGNYTNEIIELLNKYFDIAIIVLHTYQMNYNFAAYYNGQLFIRAFGLQGETTYEDFTESLTNNKKGYKGRIEKFKLLLLAVLKWYGILRRKPKKNNKDKRKNRCNNKLTRALKSRKNGFVFAPCYKSIIENEPPIFADKAVYLPLSVPQYIFDSANTWTGGDNRIMFVCPDISTRLTGIYYYRVYSEFVKYFSDLPYLVAGNQHGAEFEDKNIQGFAERDQFNEWLRTCSCMYYSSREKRHIHYHPIEAVIFGMPLIYLSGGLLEYFGGPDQPGMAKTEKEARQKIERIQNGDIEFIKEIKEKQVKIINEFTYDYVRGVWEKSFLPIVGDSEKCSSSKELKGKKEFYEDLK